MSTVFVSVTLTAQRLLYQVLVKHAHDVTRGMCLCGVAPARIMGVPLILTACVTEWLLLLLLTMNTASPFRNAPAYLCTHL